jgi:ADP-ribose pyrophosphatase YjhB (NUDIX family)
VIEPIKAEWKWRTCEDLPTPAPYVTTSGFAVDPHGNFPLIYRGPNVRSAKNCWSLPSGLHECGFTLAQQFAVELGEELNLEADPTRGKIIGVYENIAAVDKWHWVIAVLVMPVKTLDTMVNKEPDKHPEMRRAHYTQLTEILGLNWAPQLGPFIQENASAIRKSIVRLL